jgi:prephenate dehydrogenase
MPLKRMNCDTSIGIVGLGLIGGSIAKALLDVGVRVSGYDIKPETCAKAQSDGIVIYAKVDELFATSSVVFLATPLEAYAGYASTFRALEPRQDVLLIDVGSARGPFSDLVRVVSENRAFRFLGSHPMAGTEDEGYDHARGDLFVGATWVVLIEPETSFDHFVAAVKLLLRFNAFVLPASRTSHDDAVARVSHASHAVAGLLARAAATSPERSLALRVASGSFRDGTRVMSSRPAFVTDFCVYNRDALLPILRDVAADLAKLIESLAVGDRSETTAFFERAHAIRREFLDLSLERPTIELALRGTGDWKTTLIEHGRRGYRLAIVEHRGGTTIFQAV